MTEKYNRDGNPNPKKLKSSSSMVCSFVRFVNKTTYNVDTIWINYEGQRSRYKKLRPNEYVDVNTYVGHPWIFLDADTGNRMVVQMKEVFESTEGWKAEDNVPPQRKVYNITLPLYPLKERCLQYLTKRIRQEDVEQLELPHDVQTELESKFDAIRNMARTST